MNAVFVDTGYLLALEIANDQHHQAAVQYWQRMAAALPPLVTTSYVFDEVVTFFNSRGYHAKAVQVGTNLLHSPSTQLIHVDEALFYEGWTYFQRHQDKDYSLLHHSPHAGHGACGQAPAARHLRIQVVCGGGRPYVL